MEEELRDADDPGPDIARPVMRCSGSSVEECHNCQDLHHRVGGQAASHEEHRVGGGREDRPTFSKRSNDLCNILVMCIFPRSSYKN